jgi:hypothetical protein
MEDSVREDIIRMAREAGYQEDMFGFGIWDSKEFNAFAALVAAAEREAIKWNSIHSCHTDCQNPACVIVREAVAAEREACAKVAAWVLKMPENDVSAAIRARGNK